ncbi:MAG: hypothetical protein JXK07_13485 [Spirochaetes bacterium]|nr:hypothetical protein [Spirochaetota bacterium]
MLDPKQRNICETLKCLSSNDPEIAFNLALASLESTQLCLDNAVFIYSESMKCNERYERIISHINTICERFVSEEKLTVDVAIILHVIGDWKKK